MTFTTDTLESIDAAHEVHIETRREDGRAYRTVIWIMVEDDAVYVRSVRGDDGRWYQRATKNPAVKIVVGSFEIDAVARAAPDEQSVRSASEGLRRKYSPGTSLDAMLAAAVLHTTLRLEPLE
jgi:hypothetical protein